jgi:hypothetical protein
MRGILEVSVRIAAQAPDTGIPAPDFVIATVNVGRLALFAPAEEWANIVLLAAQQPFVKK